jgi:urease accessory protein
MSENEKLLNLLRISDTFFPMGSFAMSQGMEQIINDNLVPKEKLVKVIKTYLEKVWKSFDFGIFHNALQAVEAGNIEMVRKMDEICHSSKITEENRTAIVKMGNSMMNAVDFEEDTIGKAYKDLIKNGTAYGTYPVVLALTSNQFNLKDLGALSLMYVNLMEVTASLVRMGIIDYIEAQKLLREIIKSIQLSPLRLCDFNQSFPLADIASMRHELSQSRMFIS